MRRAIAAVALAAAAVGAGAQEEVPFVTTPDHVIAAMLDIAKVGPQDFLLDLGSGDGRIVIEAARRTGARGLGVEIVPDLVEKSRRAAEAAGVADRAHFREQDLMQADLSVASVITMYLLPEVNMQLRPKLLNLRPGTRIVSHDWDMGDWPADRTLTIDVPDKALGREKVSRVYLWIVPARVQGVWCGIGKGRGKRLEVRQTFQKFEARTGPASEDAIDGRIDGAILHGARGVTFVYDGQTLYNTHASGRFAPLHGVRFKPLRGKECR